MSDFLQVDKKRVVRVQFVFQYRLKGSDHWTVGWIGDQQEVRDRAASMKSSVRVAEVRVNRVIEETIHQEANTSTIDEAGSDLA